MAHKAQGLSQLALAERSGLSADFIGKVERGTTSPSLESLKAIADALHLPLHDLFEGEPGASPGPEVLLALVQPGRGREKEDVELRVGMAQLIFRRRRDRLQKSSRGGAVPATQREGARPTCLARGLV
jgi:transcriptional regulator with XRE-family HTH domain